MTVGVPLMVHVLLSMFKPFGRLGEATQLVALVRLVMPPEPLPEPLAALALYWKVMLVMASSMMRSAPSTLEVKLLCEEPEPPVSRTSLLSSSVSSSFVHVFSVSRKPAWVIKIIRKERMTAFESWPLLTLRINDGCHWKP